MKHQPLANSTHARDLAYYFHPYTNLRAHQEHGPIVIERGKGIYVYDDQGNEYLEGLAGLWSVAIGYGEERLVAAAAEQMRKMPYYHTFAHKANKPAVELAEKLIALAPGALQRVFFANSGSEANDTAVKLVWYYNNARGRPEKKKIISRLRAYHGITVASGSLTGLPWNHHDFDLPIANILHTSCPHYYRYGLEGETEEEFASRMASDLEDLIKKEGPETVAAFIGEPIMGAGGVIVPPSTYWRRIQEVCSKYDVLVIADEVINGFGRVGRMFACEYFGIQPDIMVVSKQLTSSYLPLSAVLLTEGLYQTIADNSARVGMFGHGFTTSGHPVATALALENLKIIEERCLVENAERVGNILQKSLRSLESHPLIGEVRGVGLIAAVELVANKKTREQFNPIGKLGSFFFERAHQHGLIIRNVQDSIAVCPPLIINESEVGELVKRIAATLKDVEEFAKSLH